MSDASHARTAGDPAAPGPILMLVYERYERDSRVRRHVRALVGAGRSVAVLALGAAAAADAAAADGASFTSLGVEKYRGGSRLQYVVAYGRFIIQAGVRVARWRHPDPSVVWVNAPPDVLVLASLGARLRGIPVLLDVHDLSSELFAAKFGRGGPVIALVRLVERLSYRMAAAVLTVHGRYVSLISSRAGGRPVIEVLNVPDDDTWLGIGRDRLAEAAQNRSPLRLGHHGTIARRFGADLAVRAVAVLREAHVDVRLRILGDGDGADAVTETISELGLTDVVEFERRVFTPDEVPGFVAAIDVGLAPYRPSPFVDEILPVKVIEYLALGIPVVATPTHALRAYLPDEGVTYLTEATPEAIGHGVRELADATERRRQANIGHAAVTAIGWPIQRERLLTALDAALERDERH